MKQGGCVENQPHQALTGEGTVPNAGLELRKKAHLINSI